MDNTAVKMQIYEILSDFFENDIEKINLWLSRT